MGSALRVGVMGAGAVGCYVGGRLLAAEAADVVLVGRSRLRDDLAGGLTLEDLSGPPVRVPAEALELATEPEALAGCDAVLCCVKSGQTDAVAADLAGVLGPDTVVVSLQNGVRNAEVLRGRLGERTVLAGIVGFNVVWGDGGVFRRATSGPITIEASGAARARALVDALRASGIEVAARDEIGPDQWAKLLINLNNSVSALSGAPTRDLITTPGYRRVVSAVMGEGVRVLRAAGIKPAAMRGVPIGLLARLLRMPTFLVRLLARAQMKVDPEARSSMYQDLSRGRTTEVDFLNGEIVTLADRHGVDAPLNRRIVELVRQAEAEGSGSPGLAPDELWSSLHD